MFNANQILLNQYNMLGILMTFGVVFPPLAVALAFTICLTTLFARKSRMASASPSKTYTSPRKLRSSRPRMSYRSSTGIPRFQTRARSAMTLLVLHVQPTLVVLILNAWINQEKNTTSHANKTQMCCCYPQKPSF